MELGTPQGTVSGSILWKVFINELLSDLEKLRGGVEYLCFADDLVLMCPIHHKRTAVQHTQEALDTVQTWSSENNMILSEKKTVFAVFRSEEKSEPEDDIHLAVNGSQIAADDSPKFLGVRLDPGLTMCHQVDHVVKKCTKRMAALRSLSSASWKPQARQLRLLYQALITSTLTYAAPSWMPLVQEKDLQRLNGIQAEGASLILGLPKTTRREVLLHEANLKPVQQILRKESVVLLSKALSRPAEDPLRIVAEQANEGWITIGKEFLREMGIRESDITPEFISKTWSGPSVTDEIERGRITVSTNTVIYVEGEMAKYDVAIFCDGASLGGRGACGGAVFDAKERRYIGGGGGPLGKGVGSLTAEKEALSLAVKLAKGCQEVGGCKKRAVIFTDSLEALRSIQSAAIGAPVDQVLQESILDTSLSLDFKHVRGHAGNPGNEYAHSIASFFVHQLHLYRDMDTSATPDDIKRIAEEMVKSELLGELKRISSTSDTTKHLLSLCGPGPNPVLKSSTHLNRREEIVFNRLRVNSFCILVESRPGGGSVNAPTKSECPWCRLTGDAEHYLEKCVCLREEIKLLNYDHMEPLLSTEDKPAPYIRALVCKLCQ